MLLNPLAIVFLIMTDTAFIPRPC